MKIKKYIPFMGPKFDEELNKVWQGTYFTLLNLNVDFETAIEAASKTAREFDKTRKEFTNA